MGCQNSHGFDTSEPIKVSCHCGQVEMTMLETLPRIQLQCCCRDCCQRVEWALTNGAKGDMLGSTGPVHNVLLANCITSIKGKDQLKTYKRRENDKGTMVIAECCKALIAIPHTGLGNNVFVCPADVCVVQARAGVVGRDKAEARTFVNDFDKAKDPNVGEMPPFNALPGAPIIGAPSPVLMMTTPFLRRFMSQTGKKPIRPEGSITIHDIVAEKGKPEMLGLKPMEHPKKNI